MGPPPTPILKPRWLVASGLGQLKQRTLEDARHGYTANLLQTTNVHIRGAVRRVEKGGVLGVGTQDYMLVVEEPLNWIH